MNNTTREGMTRTAFYVKKELLQRCDSSLELANCRSRNELVNKAIDFYLGYIHANHDTEFLAPVIYSMVSGTIGSSEHRLSRMDFKIAVELAKVSHILASQCDIDDEQLRRLHIKCVDEVKRINGTIRFDEAVDFQQG